ncbi:hypothetical protein [Singulisphaera sp. GP187]|uniref:hypothetical protein n=1 Tax=Singulisphaera sp. GP187 TaxID=1882752 RepID=UPI00116126E8|nr:hypothetical protein [Singulisphaera sp. GP187]
MKPPTGEPPPPGSQRAKPDQVFPISCWQTKTQTKKSKIQKYCHRCKSPRIESQLTLDRRIVGKINFLATVGLCVRCTDFIHAWIDPNFRPVNPYRPSIEEHRQRIEREKVKVDPDQDRDMPFDNE